MKIVGLTGVIGSGKSTAANFFSLLGAPVFMADKYAKEIMINDMDIKNGLIDLLGKHTFIGDELNKKFISQQIFNNKKLLKSVNKLVHPKVNEGFSIWVKNQSFSYVIYEAALIFENNSNNIYDKVVCIKSPIELIYRRLRKRNNYSRPMIDRILQNQLSQDIKCLKSDYCVENISLNKLKSQVSQIHESLL